MIGESVRVSDQGGPRRFGLGIVGLGRLWEVRHRPALERMRDRFRVAAVYDEVPARTKREAERLGRVGAESVKGLVERDDVDAVMLLTPQWFGLHPLFIACEARKPVYGAIPLASERPDVLDALDSAVRESGIAYVPEFARRCYPAVVRLKELLGSRLGRARLIHCHTRLFGFDRYGAPGPSTQGAPWPMLVDPGGFLIDWCRHLMDDEPTDVSGAGGSILPGGTSRDFETVTLRFASGGVARIEIVRNHRQVWGDPGRFLPPPGVQVFAERGAAWIEPPDRLGWSDSEGEHDERFPLEPSVGERLCEGFHRVLSGEVDAAPGWADALSTARLVHRLGGT